MRLGFLLIFFMHCCSAYAQTHRLGGVAGLTIPWVDRANYPYYKVTRGITVGADYNFGKKWFTMRSSVGYKIKGFSQEVIYVNEAGEVLGMGNKEHNRFHYFGVEQSFGTRFGNKLFGFALIGGSLDYYMKTTTKLKLFILENGQIHEGYKVSQANQTKFDFSVISRIGGGYKIDEKREVYMQASYHYGLTRNRYTIPDVITLYPWNNRYLSIEMGFRKKI